MNVKLYSAPWCNPKLTTEAVEAMKIMSDDVWKNASIDFYATRDAKLSAGKSAPKGMQRFINDILCGKYIEKGWAGDSGYFYKNKTWVRITFRHQMSLGSDIVDAIKVCKKEGMELAIILAANKLTLDVISPNDANALVSFEKLYKEIMSLDGAIDIPLIIGELSPRTSASQAVNQELLRERPRDIYIPQKLENLI